MPPWPRPRPRSRAGPTDAGRERIALLEKLLEVYRPATPRWREAISLEMGAPISLSQTAQAGSRHDGTSRRSSRR